MKPNTAGAIPEMVRTKQETSFLILQLGGGGVEEEASHRDLFKAAHLEVEDLGEKCTIPAKKQPLHVSDQVPAVLPHSSLKINKDIFL